QALCRRRVDPQQPAPEDGQRQIEIQDLVIDLDRLQVRRGQVPIAVTQAEFQVLAQPARNSGNLMSATEILTAVGHYELSESDAKAWVKVLVSRLRRKLGD